MKVALLVVWLLVCYELVGQIAAFAAEPSGEPVFPLIFIFGS